jgi:hypothetical protein
VVSLFEESTILHSCEIEVRLVSIILIVLLIPGLSPLALSLLVLISRSILLILVLVISILISSSFLSGCACFPAWSSPSGLISSRKCGGLTRSGWFRGILLVSILLIGVLLISGSSTGVSFSCLLSGLTGGGAGGFLAWSDLGKQCVSGGGKEGRE